MTKSTQKFFVFFVKLHISKHSTSFAPEENQISPEETANKLYRILDGLKDKCTPL